MPHHNIDQAINILLPRLKDLDQLLNVATTNRAEMKKAQHNIHFFISAISDLVETSNTLRLDTDYVLVRG